LSRPGTVIYGLTPTCSLVVTAPDVDAALTHAEWVAHGLGFEQPAELSSVITEDHTESTTEVWSDITHEEAIRLIQGREQRRTSVFAVVSASSDNAEG
jgi:hypothetical protein